MKVFSRYSFLLLAVLVTAAANTDAQTPLSGRVTGVTDGRTFVLETDSGRVTAAIQYIDVPEPEQPLSRVTREHFQSLVAGKMVTFVSSGFSPSALIGKLYLNGLDVGQQLIRDGAAWHVPVERSGQNFDDARSYVGLQILAKAERRGIWSIANLTPPWEFRALKEKTFRDVSFLQAAAEQGVAEDTRNYKPFRQDTDFWTEVGGAGFARRTPMGEVSWGYDPDKMIRNIATSSIAQVLVGDKKALEVEVRAIYFQGEIQPRNPNIAYVFAIAAIGREHSLKQNVLTLEVDGGVLDLGAGQRMWRENAWNVQEMLQYRISRSDLARIAEAGKATVHVGAYSGNISTDLQRAIRELLKAAG